MPSAAHVRRALQATSVVGALWSVVVVISGGVVVPQAAIQISSRSPQNALLIALLASFGAIALSRPHVWQTLRGDARWWGGHAARTCRAARAGWPRLPAALLAGAAGVLEVRQWAGARPLWLDEQMIALNLRERAITDLDGALWLGQSAPFGWLTLQRVALLTLGESEPALRFVPLCFGLATLAAALWIGRRWMGPAGATLLMTGVCSQWLLYYVFELKPYSGDVFWALWLPALAAWAVEAEGQSRQAHRAALWWGAAAVGLWTANGALLVAPGCAAVLIADAWRRHGWRVARARLPFAALWLASFGLHYVVSLRHALGSAYLGDYWAFALPPRSAGAWGTLVWLTGQLEPLALKPGGSGWSVLFWLSAAAGLALTRRRTLALAMASVPLSAFTLAVLRLVPLFERLSLWAMPALYVGIALFADRMVAFGQDRHGRLVWGRRGVALAGAVVVLVVCADLFARGRPELTRPVDMNHQLDDRKAVEWLMFNRQPGDVVVATRLALPAIWWYGRIPIADPVLGARLADGGPVLEVEYLPPGPRCRDNGLRTALSGRSRALVYFGFRFDDVPAGFDGLLLDALGELGGLRAFQVVTGVGRVAVVDLGVPPVAFRARLPALQDGPARLDGCVGARVAARW
jgi:hypothetical protein